MDLDRLQLLEETEEDVLELDRELQEDLLDDLVDDLSQLLSDLKQEYLFFGELSFKSSMKSAISSVFLTIISSMQILLEPDSVFIVVL